MTLSTVTLNWDLTDLIEAALEGTLSITPTAQMSDTADHILIPPVARTWKFTGGTGSLAGIVANDNASVLPQGTGYLISVTDENGKVIVPQFQTQLLSANGATQWLDALATVPVVTTSYQYLPVPSGTPAAGQVPGATGAGEASAWGNVGMTAAGDMIIGGASGIPARLAGNTSAVQALLAQTGNGTASAAPVWMYPAAQTLPKPTGVAATDTAAIQAAENALNALGGGALLFQPGTYAVTGLVKQSNTTWQGAGWLTTFLQLSAGSNTDVIQGANFGTLTLGGTAAGITGWSIRDMCIDGNKSAQSGTSYGLRFYGYNCGVSRVIIRNCLTDGLYSEWANNAGGVTDGMEPYYEHLKIHNCGVNGWHDRGPHDARSFDVTIWANGSAGKGYWAETSLATTVAAGSNGADLSTFTSGSPGTLNVATTLGYATASISGTQGGLRVATALGDVILTYAGTTATSFTGCVAQGSPASGSTVSTGSGVNINGGGFTANGQLHTQMHVYANPLYDYVLDCQVHLVDCVGEVTQDNGAMILLRYGNCMITGGLFVIYGGTTQHGCGIQLGDAANPASSNRIDATVYGLAGASAATAALNIVNSGANNSVDLLVWQTSGQAVFGNPSRDRVRIFSSGSGVYATDAGNSLVRDYGAVQHFVPPSTGNAWRISNSSGDCLNFDSANNRMQHLSGMFSRWYTDQYATPTVEINGSNGRVQPGTTAGRGGSIFSGSGAPNVTVAVAGDRYLRTDIAGGRSYYVATGANTWGPLLPADLPAGTTSAQGALQLDGTAADIQPVGAAANAGNAGLAADAKHVHVGLLPSNNLSDVGSPATALANIGGMVKQAATAAAGYTLVNGTGTVISWTVPNDGALHAAVIPVSLVVTTGETGGQILLNYTTPDGTARTTNYVSAGLAAGFYGPSSAQFQTLLCAPGSTVSLTQNTALTAGAAKLWAQIWGA